MAGDITFVLVHGGAWSQDEMIARLPDPVTVVDLDTGHIPAITDVDAMAAVLERAAASVVSST
jgi:hypothetical protein